MIRQICNRYEDKNILRIFLNNAGKSLDTFRYYSKRSLGALENHIYTILLLDESTTPVAYGHLDKENDVIWLGICVAELYANQGHGKLVMKELLQWSESNNICSISLKVDLDNISAIQLYHKFGFKTYYNVDKESCLMRLKLQ